MKLASPDQSPKHAEIRAPSIEDEISAFAGRRDQQRIIGVPDKRTPDERAAAEIGPMYFASGVAATLCVIAVVLGVRSGMRALSRLLHRRQEKMPAPMPAHELADWELESAANSFNRAYRETYGTEHAFAAFSVADILPYLPSLVAAGTLQVRHAMTIERHPAEFMVRGGAVLPVRIEDARAEYLGSRPKRAPLPAIELQSRFREPPGTN